MTDTHPPIDYDALAAQELTRASEATTPAQRNAHLDQAAVYATLAERQRRPVQATLP